MYIIKANKDLKIITNIRSPQTLIHSIQHVTAIRLRLGGVAAAEAAILLTCKHKHRPWVRYRCG